SGGKKIAIVIRDARRTELGALDGSFVVRKSEAQRQIFERIPFKSRRVTYRVIIFNFENVRGRHRVLKNYRHALQAAPLCPRDIRHDCKSAIETLVKTQVKNRGEI